MNSQSLRQRDPAFHAMISTLERLSIQAAEEASRAKIAWGRGELFSDSEFPGDALPDAISDAEIAAASPEPDYKKLYRDAEKKIADLQYEVDYLREFIVGMGRTGAKGRS